MFHVYMMHENVNWYITHRHTKVYTRENTCAHVQYVLLYNIYMFLYFHVCVHLFFACESEEFGFLSLFLIFFFLYVCVCVCVCVCVSVCVCVFVHFILCQFARTSALHLLIALSVFLSHLSLSACCCCSVAPLLLKSLAKYISRTSILRANQPHRLSEQA